MPRVFTMKLAIRVLSLRASFLVKTEVVLDFDTYKKAFQSLFNETAYLDMINDCLFETEADFFLFLPHSTLQNGEMSA